MNLGYFIFRYDYAKATNFSQFTGKPIHYFSFGADF
jgi:hypothetical protein